jgi:hypothetical protein
LQPQLHARSVSEKFSTILADPRYREVLLVLDHDGNSDFDRLHSREHDDAMQLLGFDLNVVLKPTTLLRSYGLLLLSSVTGCSCRGGHTSPCRGKACSVTGHPDREQTHWTKAPQRFLTSAGQGYAVGLVR